MVDGKTILKGAGVVVLGVVLISVAVGVINFLFGVVAWAIGIAIRLLVLGLLVYGVYWAYTTFISESKSSTREREKIFER